MAIPLSRGDEKIVARSRVYKRFNSGYVIFPLERGVLEGSKMYAASDYGADRELHIYNALCGNYRCSRDYLVRRQYYEHLLLLYVTGGTFQLKYQDAEYLAGKDDIVLIDCQIPHEYMAKGGVKFMFTHFGGGKSREIVAQILVLCGPVIKPASSAYIKARLGELIAPCLEGSPPSPLASSAIIYDSLCRLYPETEETQAKNRAVYTAIEIMRYTIGCGAVMSVTDLALSVNFSKFHFSRIFHKVTGLSPYDYYMNMRIEEGKKMLSATDKSVEEIAFSLGYQNSSSFSSVFSAKTGKSPSEYRKTVSA
jgi:AraC-like DNA-binding protein